MNMLKELNDRLNQIDREPDEYIKEHHQREDIKQTAGGIKKITKDVNAIVVYD